MKSAQTKNKQKKNLEHSGVRLISLSFSHNWLLILICSSVTIKKKPQKTFSVQLLSLSRLLSAVLPAPPQAHLRSGSAELRGRSLPVPHCGGSDSRPPSSSRAPLEAPGARRHKGCSSGGLGAAGPRPGGDSAFGAPGGGPAGPPAAGGARCDQNRGRRPVRPARRAGERRSPIGRAPSASPPRRPRVPGPYRPLGSLGARRGCRGLSGTAAPHRPILPAPRSRHRRATRPAPGT